jgi:hypothetical protein
MAPTPIDRLHLRHDPSEIFGDGQITEHDFLQTSYAVFSVIVGVKMIEAQQLCQPAGVDLVTLVASPHGGILSRIASNIISSLSSARRFAPRKSSQWER